MVLGLRGGVYHQWVLGMLLWVCRGVVSEMLYPELLIYGVGWSRNVQGDLDYAVGVTTGDGVAIFALALCHLYLRSRGVAMV